MINYNRQLTNKKNNSLVIEIINLPQKFNFIKYNYCINNYLIFIFELCHIIFF